MSFGVEPVAVMPGLVPGIHVFLHFRAASKSWMAGNKSAFTRVCDALCPAMTEQVALS
jgi:hypothetical protein